MSNPRPVTPPLLRSKVNGWCCFNNTQTFPRDKPKEQVPPNPPLSKNKILN